MLGRTNYLALIEKTYVQVILHFIVIFNAYFLIKGEKYYNENVGLSKNGNSYSSGSYSWCFNL